MNVKLNIFEHIRNPKIFFMTLMVISFLLLLFMYDLSSASYYTDKNAAHELLNNSINITIEQVDSIYLNRSYLLHNSLYHYFLISVCCYLYTVIFKVQSFNDLKNIKIFNNKIFSYCFINIFYYVWAYYMQKILELDIIKYVYPIHSDSIGIPMFIIAVMLHIFGIFYYIVMNVLNFIVYNTKLANRFLIILYKILILLLALFMILNLSLQFSWYYIIIYLLELLYFIYFLNSIEYLKYKNRPM